MYSEDKHASQTKRPAAASAELGGKQILAGWQIRHVQLDALAAQVCVLECELHRCSYSARSRDDSSVMVAVPVPNVFSTTNAGWPRDRQPYCGGGCHWLHG